jgi:ATP-dependent helicase/nuclease subunit A
MTLPDTQNPLNAASPERNASVHASAGTGKTWLLVTRIIRLLLEEVSPDSILAITFTRKAAAEMQQRLNQRLRELMSATDEALDTLLRQCGLEPEPGVRQRARRLYEQNLFKPYPLRATTFHAFCQELLHRFPLEAGIPPGFEILESTARLEQAAWDALFAQATRAPDSPLAQALDQLIARCTGLSNTRNALLSFLSHRSDWWAWTRGQANAVHTAERQLARLLKVTADEDPLHDFPTGQQRRRLLEFAQLLGRNTSTDRKYQQVVTTALATAQAPDEIFAHIKAVFLTTADAPRKRTASAAQQKRLGEAGEQRYLELHEQISSDLLDRLDRLARINTLRTSRAWYLAGSQLLEHYQRIKQEQRLLDFADLEWQACELLNRSEHASWVQYKLDQRIDHLLVDEFQDTNPTQWRLLLPLLEELAAGDGERTRSVFLVGDEKQSIYRFRRANPALLAAASGWLEENLQAVRYPLDKSRRSAPAVIEAVNRVFSSGVLNDRISNYTTHDTWHTELYGHVELLPLVTEQPAAAAAESETGLRNPLLQPRRVEEDQRYYREGRGIAQQIHALVTNETLIGPVDAARRINYGDIMILVRQRTHTGAYERALRDSGIPYLGAGRGTLLESIEIRDLEALLNSLISPYDNLALAQVLRSPLFGVTDNDLMRLAAHPKGTWYERLAATGSEESPELAAACQMLAGWRDLVGQIPVHDLLDRIYHEGEVFARYASAFPPALRPRARANLTRFIELALEVDSGRYPSLPRFLEQLHRLRRFDQDQPDEGAPEEADSNRIRLMTIHGAKGLESPVVFIADTAAPQKKPGAYEALIDWPASADRPVHYLLRGTRADQDSITRGLLDKQRQEDLREDANLLYVAMTRARQFLFISGSGAANSRDASWYDMIHSALESCCEKQDNGNLVLETGRLPTLAMTTAVQTTGPSPDPRLREKIRIKPALVQIAPSRTVETDTAHSGDPDGLERGLAIHLMLDRLSRASETDHHQLLTTLAGALGRDLSNPELQAWWDEACLVYNSPRLAHLFDKHCFEKAWNEVPLQYLSGSRMVYGIIDRLVLGKDSVLLIDYKTHRSATAETLGELARTYTEQIQLYAKGAALLWPDLKIDAFLLFTSCNKLVPMDTETGTPQEL